MTDPSNPPQRDRDASSPADAPRAADQVEEFALLERARAGDREALADLLERYQGPIYNLCLRMVGARQHELAADIAQDTLVRLIERLDAFDGRSLLSTWVYRVTANVCYSRLRAEKLRRHAPLEASSPVQSAKIGAHAPPHAEQHAESSVQLAERRRRVADALLELDEDHRLILLLRDAHGLDYEQIAQALQIPVGTVKSRLFRARASLRNAVEQLEDTPE